MVYRALGISSNTIEHTLDLAFVSFEVSGQKWAFETRQTMSIPYSAEWISRLQGAASLAAVDYLQLHVDYGHLIANSAKQFISDQQLDYQVQLIAVAGHPGFYSPAAKMSHQLGDGAAVAAITGVNVVSDFNSIHMALGGTPPPVISIAEKTLGTLEPLVYKEAVAAAFFAVLRWREENNFFSEGTGAARDSIGGAVWVGQEW